MSMNVKSPSPPFIFFVKKCDPPQEAVKFIVTHPFLLTNMVCGWFKPSQQWGQFNGKPHGLEGTSKQSQK